LSGINRPSKTSIAILANPTNYFHNKICQQETHALHNSDKKDHTTFTALTPRR
jgi:hypothetical protein